MASAALHHPSFSELTRVSARIGFLSFGATGPFKGTYNSIAGDAWADWLFMLGLLTIGVALVLGVFVNLAAAAGALLLVMMWTAVLPPENNPFMDDHLIYALTLGLTNGDLFTHAIAFSPGMLPLRERHGAPAVFVAHGTRDEILPIDLCSRRIVPELERLRYRVEYVEFDGLHTVVPAIAGRAVRWFLS